MDGGFGRKEGGGEDRSGEQDAGGDEAPGLEPVEEGSLGGGEELRAAGAELVCGRDGGADRLLGGVARGVGDGEVWLVEAGVVQGG